MKEKPKNVVVSIAEEVGISKADTARIIQMFAENVVELVAAGEKIRIAGLGTFERKKRKARVGINPATGEKIIIKSKCVPTFKAAKPFKEIVEKMG